MFRMYSSPQHGVRVSVVAEHSEGELRLAVARCSKKDQFIKRKGRAIAEGRLAKGRLFFRNTMPTCSIKEFYEIANRAVQRCVVTKETVREV